MSGNLEYSGEHVDSEGGDETAFHVTTVADLVRLIRTLKDGDALVINAHEKSRF